jgi:putative intracellular protease/amidase
MTTTVVKHIGILLFSDVEELDAIGPWEVLSYWTQNHPEDGFAVSCLSKDGGLVRCSKGLVVQAHHSYAHTPPLEVLIYPGGRGTRAQPEDQSAELGPSAASRRAADDERLHRLAGIRGRRFARAPARHDALGLAGQARRT